MYKLTITAILILLLPVFIMKGQNRWTIEHDVSIAWTVNPGETHNNETTCLPDAENNSE